MSNSMSDYLAIQCTAFAGHRRIARGPIAEVALAVRVAEEAAPEQPVLTFDDRTGCVIDLDLRGSDEEILARLQARGSAGKAKEPEAVRGRGRPKLGVTSREISLLPRHWDWLAAQPGSASQVLRRLVDEARKAEGDRTDHRRARDAAYCFMSAMAGDLPDFEEASRALFAGDSDKFAARTAGWPGDVRDHVRELAQNAFPATEAAA